jgi:myo-inositol 2-dehydrogenase/D-chiro-inositol 1-dehydrogenase
VSASSDVWTAVPTSALPLRIGVGFLGAGPAVRTVHLPTLSRLTDLFQVHTVYDLDEQAAFRVAGMCEARVAADLDDFLNDAALDVVAVCTPDRFHAQHTVRCLEANKSVVFCEKPLATNKEDLASIRTAAQASSSTLVVGTMHTFDPVWRALSARVSHDITLVRSRITLPLNTKFERWAAGWSRPVPPMSNPGKLDPAAQAALISDAVLGLAMHDVPLIRRLAPEVAASSIVSARVITPFGYALVLDAGGTVVQLTGLIHEHWEPTWELEAIGSSQHLYTSFTPSFVHAGSARGFHGHSQGRHEFEPRAWNGYEAEWRSIAAQATDDGAPLPPVTEFIDDCEAALHIAGEAAKLLGEES